MKFSIKSALVASAGLVAGHMEMTYPAPFRSKFNSVANPNTVDYSMTAPLANSGAGGFPCKGYEVDLGTPYGASVANWSPGSQRNMTITGGAAHEGGSCQASLSYDGGKTFTVIHSYIGNCPVLGTSSFDFTVPADAPTGPAVFSWSWNNKVGNREMYMNCASITIAGAATRRASPAVAFSARPAIFIGNVDNSPCGTLEGADVMYPSPGPSDDMTVTSSKTAPPTNINGGSCPVDASSNPAPSSPNSPSEPVKAVDPVSAAPSSSQQYVSIQISSPSLPSLPTLASSTDLFFMTLESPMAVSPLTGSLAPSPSSSSSVVMTTMSSSPVVVTKVSSSSLAMTTMSSPSVVMTTLLSSYQSPLESNGITVIPIPDSVSPAPAEPTPSSFVTTILLFIPHNTPGSLAYMPMPMSLQTSSSVGGVFVTTLTGTIVPTTAGQATLATTLISYTILTTPVSSSLETGTPSATSPLSFETNSPAGPVPDSFVTNSPSAPVSAPAVVSSSSAEAAAPVATSAPSVPVPASPSAPAGVGLQTVGSPCADEGLWNCINSGAAFQRCASGQWSAVIQMAAGTACIPGMSANLQTRGLIRGASGLRSGV